MEFLLKDYRHYNLTMHRLEQSCQLFSSGFWSNTSSALTARSARRMQNSIRSALLSRCRHIIGNNSALRLIVAAAVASITDVNATSTESGACAAHGAAGEGNPAAPALKRCQVIGGDEECRARDRGRQPRRGMTSIFNPRPATIDYRSGTLLT